MTKTTFLLARFHHQLWVRAVLYCILGVASVAVSLALGPHFEKLGLHEWPKQDAVKDLLTIMATSMLVVATFSLQTMVSSYAAASSSTTPRASQLLIEDTTAQRALSTFIGAFLFSIVGLIALGTGLYDSAGRSLLFAVSILVIVLVVATMLRWVHHLITFGRVADTVDRVEAATLAALLERARHSRQGAAPPKAGDSSGAWVHTDALGYVRMIDFMALQRVAERESLQIHVQVSPGAFVELRRPLALIEGTVSTEARAEIRRAFILGDTRTFEQDPRFGLIVLSEIASRALSPAMNDPGTAIDVIGTVVRLLSRWVETGREAEDEVRYPRVTAPELSVDDMLDDVFNPIARDGATILEVQLRLQRAFRALIELGHPPLTAAAKRHAEMALQRTLPQLQVDGERERLLQEARRSS